jgi:hypothetical protein
MATMTDSINRPNPPGLPVRSKTINNPLLFESNYYDSKSLLMKNRNAKILLSKTNSVREAADDSLLDSNSITTSRMNMNFKLEPIDFNKKKSHLKESSKLYKKNLKIPSASSLNNFNSYSNNSGSSYSRPHYLTSSIEKSNSLNYTIYEERLLKEANRILNNRNDLDNVRSKMQRLYTPCVKSSDLKRREAFHISFSSKNSRTQTSRLNTETPNTDANNNNNNNNNSLTSNSFTKPIIANKISLSAQQKHLSQKLSNTTINHSTTNTDSPNSESNIVRTRDLNSISVKTNSDLKNEATDSFQENNNTLNNLETRSGVNFLLDDDEDDDRFNENEFKNRKNSSRQINSSTQLKKLSRSVNNSVLSELNDKDLNNTGNNFLITQIKTPKCWTFRE